MRGCCRPLALPALGSLAHPQTPRFYARVLRPLALPFLRTQIGGLLKLWELSGRIERKISLGTVEFSASEMVWGPSYEGFCVYPLFNLLRLREFSGGMLFHRRTTMLVVFVIRRPPSWWSSYEEDHHAGGLLIKKSAMMGVFNAIQRYRFAHGHVHILIPKPWEPLF